MLDSRKHCDRSDLLSPDSNHAKEPNLKTELLKRNKHVKIKKASELEKFCETEKNWQTYHANKLSQTHFESREIAKNYLPNFLSTENYAFEKLKIQRILLVENEFERKILPNYSRIRRKLFKFFNYSNM